jgi:hypothetical protein
VDELPAYPAPPAPIVTEYDVIPAVVVNNFKPPPPPPPGYTPQQEVPPPPPPPEIISISILVCTPPDEAIIPSIGVIRQDLQRLSTSLLPV